MPAKRNKLPHPCPKCGSHYGTIQIIFFNGMRKVEHRVSRYDAWNKLPRPSHRRNGGYDNGVFRIGHYDSKSYAKTKKENNDQYNFQTEETKKQKLRTSQRRWCSFRSHILEGSKFIGESHISKTKNYPFFDDIRIDVYERGWQMIEKKKKS